MSAQTFRTLNRVAGRTELWTILALLSLIATIGLAVAQLVKADDDSQSVATWDDLIKRYLVFREDSYRMVVPSWYLAADQVEEVWGKEGFAGFQDQPDWFWTFDSDLLTFSAKSALAQQVKSGTRLVIYEDMTKGELLVCSLPEKDGAEPKDEIAFRSLPWPELARGDTTAQYLARELSKRRIVWQVKLKDEAQAQAEAEAAALAAPADEDGGMMRMMSGGTCSEITFTAIELSTNTVDVGLCIPDGITNVDIFASTNLMPDGFPWVLVATNLPVTTNSVVWSWTNFEETNVFLAAGDGTTDTDGDGLTDAREFYLYGTQMNAADTDEDGLPDGWEIARGLNPLSNAGDDGASGDPDEDGLSNYEEWTLGAEPLQFDTVILLGPNDLYDGGMLRLFGPGQGLQYRSLAATRAKCGFAEFIQSEPPKYYSKSTKTGNLLDGYDHLDYPDWFQREISKYATTVVDPFSCTQACTSSGTITHDAYREEIDMPCPSQIHYDGDWNNLSCDSEILVQGTYQHAWDCVVEDVQFSFNVGPFSYIGENPTSPVYWELSTNYNYVDEFDNRLDFMTLFLSETLSEEYTTGQLLANTLADIDQYGSLASLPWGDGLTWGGTCSTNAAANAALRDLSTNEMQVLLTKIGYRFRVANLQTGQIYRLNWMECFTPEGMATTSVLRTHTATIRGAGGIQYLENSSYVIEPPASDGVIEPVVWRFQMLEPDGLPRQSLSAGDSVFRSQPSCFEWQYVHPSTVVVPYTQVIQGLVEPETNPFGYNWSVSAGALDNANTETPTFNASGMSIPSTMTTVDLVLRALADPNTALNAHRTIEVYRDHLERDYENFGTGIECGAPTNSFYWYFARYGTNIWIDHSWNCFGSVWHAYDGTHDGAINDSVPTSGFTVTTYDDPIPWPTALSGLNRGDIVSFYRYNSGTGLETWQHAHTCLGAASQMYGANNQPLYGIFARSDNHGHSMLWEGGSFRWWTTSSQAYYEEMNAGYESMNPGNGLLINRIKVHRR